jgi:hypothetical protein
LAGDSDVDFALLKKYYAPVSTNYTCFFLWQQGSGKTGI